MSPARLLPFRQVLDPRRAVERERAAQLFRVLPEFLAGPTNHSIDATRLMWKFFRDHHR